MKTFDVIIIGFGKGGKTLASECAKHNKTVAVIERSAQMYGGTCINIGCIPTKTLVHQAKLASEMQMNSFAQKQAFYANAIVKKTSVVEMLREKNFHNLADNPNITIFNGVGSFVSPEVVRVVNQEDEVLLHSDCIIINTGAETIIPSIDGVKDNPFVYTSTSIMELKQLPHHLIIVGGGYIGLEFASIYASFGTAVTVLEGYSELIPREDRDIATAVKKALEKKDIRFRLNAQVQSITHSEKEATITYLDSKTNEMVSLRGDAVLLATGRKPNTQDLNLQAAGVMTDDRGAIVVDEQLRTTQPNIWAIGDVKGGLQFTYISLDDYRIVRDYLFGNHARKTSDRAPVSYSVFIDPPLSHIGLSETEAKRHNKHIRVKTIPVTAIPRAKTLGETEGLLKAVIDVETNKVWGCTLFAPESSEVINFVALAIKQGLEASDIRDFIFTHPSMSEALNDLFA